MAIVVHSFTLRFTSTPAISTGPLQIAYGCEFTASRPVKKEKLYGLKYYISRHIRPSYIFNFGYKIDLERKLLSFRLPYYSNLDDQQREMRFYLSYEVNKIRRVIKKLEFPYKVFTDAYLPVMRSSKVFNLRYNTRPIERRNNKFYCSYKLDKVKGSTKTFNIQYGIETGYAADSTIVFFTSASGVESAGYRFNGLTGGLYNDAVVISGAGTWVPFTVYALITNGSRYNSYLAEFPLPTRPTNGQNIEDINSAGLNPAYRIYLSITNVGDYKSSIFIPYIDSDSAVSVKPFASPGGL